MTKSRKMSRIAIARRRSLIEAAIRSVAEVGYNAATVASICDAAGVSRGLINHYFAGKNELLLEAIRVISEELSEATTAAMEAADQGPVDRLHALVHASFTEPGFTPDKAAVWVAFAGIARWEADFQKVSGDLWSDYRQTVARLVQTAGDLHGISVQPDMVALAFTQMVEGFWVGWASDPDQIAPDRAEATCHMFIDMIFGARDENEKGPR